MAQNLMFEREWTAYRTLKHVDLRLDSRLKHCTLHLEARARASAPHLQAHTTQASSSAAGGTLSLKFFSLLQSSYSLNLLFYSLAERRLLHIITLGSTKSLEMGARAFALCAEVMFLCSGVKMLLFLAKDSWDFRLCVKACMGD